MLGIVEPDAARQVEWHEKALDLFEKAVVLREAAGKPIPIRLAKYAVAHVLRKSGRYDEALTVLENIAATIQDPENDGGFI